MQPWHGLETSDLVYHDSMGTFTKLLIDECYFDASIWKDRRPTYHFEVKTTVSSCDTRFFVSKKQYKMVRTLRHDDVFAKCNWILTMALSCTIIVEKKILYTLSCESSMWAMATSGFVST